MIISLPHPFPLNRPSVVNIQVPAIVPLSVSVPGSSVAPVRDPSLPVGEFRPGEEEFRDREDIGDLLVKGGGRVLSFYRTF